MKRVMIWSLFILFTITGCMSSTADQTGGKEPKANVYEVGEITDRVELEKLWQKYIYHTISTIGYTHEFNFADQIGRAHV